FPTRRSSDLWAPDARSLLVTVDHQGRTLMYRYRLSDGSTEPVGPGTGTVTAATPRPRDDAWAHWSSAADPPSVVTAATGAELVRVGSRAPSSVPVQDVWAEGAAGPLHGLLRLPQGTAEPHPVIVKLHAGPN